MKEKINKFISEKVDLYKVYIVLVMLIMVIPFAMFFVMPSTSSTENKKLAEFPSLSTKEGSFNLNYMKDLSSYFEDRFAFRNELVDLNSRIRAGIFKTSPEDDVIVGSNGWLYYSATLDDFKGDDLSNNRELYSIARNIKLIQEYCENKGTKFVFTIAPNKNSLYPENMPSNLSAKISDYSDAKLLKKYLDSEEINYVDMFDLFANQDETLYLKRDSHWNKKGAVLAYNAMLDAAEFEHEDYSNIGSGLVNGTIGDLNTMIYPVTPTPEEDYVYDKDYVFTYEGGSAEKLDVTSDEIKTACENGTGNLVMYRDSFGNSLIDLFSEEFANSYFSKLEPYNISDIEDNEADVLILEKVERHIQSLYKVAPMMSALKKADLKDAIYEEAFKSLGLEYSDENEESKYELNEEAIVNLISEMSKADESGIDGLFSSDELTIESSHDGKYLEVSGEINNNTLEENARIYAFVSDITETGAYEAFLLSDNKFTLYIDTDNENIGLVIVLVSGDGKEATLFNCGDFSDTFKSDIIAVGDAASKAATAEKEIIEAEKLAKEEAERLKKEEEERLKKEQEEAERKAKEEAEKKSSEGSGKSIVSKTFYEDCGSDTGYYEIVWSDGSVTYQDVN